MPSSPDPIPARIFSLRGHRVILDADLARLYGVPTKAFNQALKRNVHRFPEDFAFQLTEEEVENLRSQIVTSSAGHGGRRYLPWVFTEHGALMAANILRTARAVEMSVYVVRAFVKQREALATNAAILKRLAEIDKTLLEHDSALKILWHRLQPLLAPPSETPKPKIGFHEGNR
jgi:hypothetical protein